MPTNLDLR